jgi:hypothetical protein
VYDESRNFDAVTGDGGMQRNTPGAREKRTDARGRAARMSSTQQSTSDGSGRGWTTATLRTLDVSIGVGVGVGVGDDATQHDTIGIRRARGRRGRKATRRRKDGRDAMGRLMRNVGRATTMTTTTKMRGRRRWRDSARRRNARLRNNNNDGWPRTRQRTRD